MNKQYSRKVAELEQEAEQARAELTEAHKQLQELEVQGSRDAADRSKAQECRRKIAAAQSKVQVRLLNVFFWSKTSMLCYWMFVKQEFQYKMAFNYICYVKIY